MKKQSIKDERKNKRSLKKITAFMLAGLMAMSTLTGCSNSGLSDMADKINNKYDTAEPSSPSDEQKVTIKFDADGGQLETSSIEIKKGEKISKIPETSKEGYTFEGWYDEQNNKLSTETIINNDTTYTAKWTEIKEPEVTKWAVSFDPNEGSFKNNESLSLITLTVNDNDLIDTSQIPNVIRDGYEFLGWYTDKTNGVLIETSAKVTKDQTYYARWKKVIQYVTVTFNGNGGTFNGSSTTAQQIEKDKTISNLPTPTRTNYTFTGWFTDSNCTKQFDATSNVSENTTLYAGWKENTPVVKNIKITFDAQGGYLNNSNQKQTITYKETDTFKTLPTAWRTDYDFIGWYTASTGGTKITNETIISSITSNDTTIYAQWQKQKDYYTITFDAAGGNCSTKSVNIKKNTEIGESNLPTPTKSDVTFGGWFDENGKQITSSAIITKDMTLTARYVDITGSNYAVTFIAKYNQGPITYTVKKNTKLGSIPSNPTRKGYLFQGWYTSYVDSSATQITANTTVNSDMTVYAKWKPQTYQMTYSLNSDETWNQEDNMFKAITMNYDTPNYIIDDVPVKEAKVETIDDSTKKVTTYSFKGWSTGDNNNLYQPDDYFVPNKYTVLSTNWKEETKEVKLDDNSNDDNNNTEPYSVKSSPKAVNTVSLLKTSNSDSDIDIQFDEQDNSDDIVIENYNNQLNSSNKSDDIIIENNDNTNKSDNGISVQSLPTNWNDKINSIINEANQFAKERVKVMFDANGGSSQNLKTITKAVDNTIHALPAAFKDGWIATGWYNGTTLYTDQTPVTQSMTLTANYSRQITESDYKNMIDVKYVRTMYKDYLLEHNIDSANSDNEIKNYFYKNMMFKGFRPSTWFDPDYYYDYVKTRYGNNLTSYKQIYNFYIGWGENHDDNSKIACKHSSSSTYDDAYVAINTNYQEDIYTIKETGGKWKCACGEIFNTTDELIIHQFMNNTSEHTGTTPITITEKVFAKEEDHAHTDRNLIIYCGNNAKQVSSKLISRVYDPY